MEQFEISTGFSPIFLSYVAPAPAAKSQRTLLATSNSAARSLAQHGRRSHTDQGRAPSRRTSRDRIARAGRVDFRRPQISVDLAQ